MIGFFICIGLAVLCFAGVAMMGNRDRGKLENFKTDHSDLYTKYAEAFDSQPRDFSGVQLNVEAVESRLLPGEVIHHSYALPRFYDKDGNLFVLTNKRLIYAGFKLTQSAFKSIPYNKIENIEVSSQTLGTELEVTSKGEKIEIYFNNFDKPYLDKFYVMLTEKQLS